MADRTLSSRRVYSGKMIALRVDELPSKNGGTREMEIVEHPGGVVVIAQPEPRTIVLVRQQRHAVGTKLWEVPAGKLEHGEDPAAAALRELQEETGYRARSLRYLWSAYSTPGFSDELLRFYVAESLQAGEPSPDENEQFEMRVFSVNDAWAMVERDELRDAKTQIALAWALRSG